MTAPGSGLRAPGLPGAWSPEPGARSFARLLRAPIAVAVLTALYVAAGIALVLTDYTLNDEGILAHYWASWARREFVPVFFFQRLKPALAALYLPASAGGVHATLIAHVVVSSLSVPLLAACARALGHRLPNLPAFVVALSPLYFYGGPAGLSNADGVVGMSASLYLLIARRAPFPAGLVAGALPWARFELAVFSAALALYALLERRDRALLAGLAVFPLLYAAGGALYHRDALWMLHFPPVTPTDPSDPAWQDQLVGPRYFLEPLLAVTPFAPVVAALRPSRLRPVERTLLLYLVVMAALINVLPALRLANFGTPPRYSLCLLPALALLAGRAFEAWWEDERPSFAAIAAVCGLAAWLATRQENVPSAAFLIAGNVLLIAAARFGLRAAAAAISASASAAGPFLPLRLDVGRTMSGPFLDPVVAWLRTHRDRVTGPVLTNSQILAPYTERRVPGLDVRFVAGRDIAENMLLLSNPANGQRDRILALCDSDLYGRTLFAPARPEMFPPGTVLALRNDIRVPRLFPEDLWNPRLRVLVDQPLYRIAELLPAEAGP